MPDTPKLGSIALVGGESLLGREVRSVFAQAFPKRKLKLIGSEEESDEVVLTEQAGEAVIMTALDADAIAGSEVLIMAGSPEATRKAMHLASDAPAPPAVLDLTYALEDRPDARLRAPFAEPPGLESSQAAVQLVAHPAAIILAAFLRRLHAAHPIQQSVVQVFEPASERGRGGVTELQRQTVNLLSFQKPVTAVFDAQLSFNLLAGYGEEAPLSLSSVEQRLEKHLATLLALDPPVPMSSLRLVQAPVMHGYTISAWVELSDTVEIKVLRKAFRAPDFDWWGPDLDPPNAVGLAGEGGVTIGAVERDRNRSRAFWFWLVADNFRIPAENAVELARRIVEKA